MMSTGRAGLICLLGLVVLGGCQRRTAHPWWRSPDRSTAIRTRPQPANAVRAAPRRDLGSLDGEPELTVRLGSATELDLVLLRPATLAGRTLSPGPLAVGIHAHRLQIAGTPVASEQAVLRFAGSGPAFACERGAAARQRTLHGGSLVLLHDGGTVMVCERLGCEAYLPGVLVREVEPDWPVAALAAQAVAARSYALSRWFARRDQPWQLDATPAIDMAYGGLPEKIHPNLAAALRSTRGQVLALDDQVLPAYFHSCSGGMTADVDSVWPGRRFPDGTTDPARALRAVRDPFAEVGAHGLGREQVMHWECRVELGEVARLLRGLGEPPLLAPRVQAVHIATRHGDGQRVATVELRSDAGAHLVPATVLRRALGSRRVRSTLWDTCLSTRTHLLLRGRGYGHGVGLSQISAWAMAHRGLDARQILAFFYRSARIERCW
ncbi:MAG: SpoIID/LytB domain-containing protein [Planctomycetota bacterium]